MLVFYNTLFPLSFLANRFDLQKIYNLAAFSNCYNVTSTIECY
jgi:hypothetical protein